MFGVACLPVRRWGLGSGCGPVAGFLPGFPLVCLLLASVAGAARFDLETSETASDWPSGKAPGPSGHDPGQGRAGGQSARKLEAISPPNKIEPFGVSLTSRSSGQPRLSVPAWCSTAFQCGLRSGLCLRRASWKRAREPGWKAKRGRTRLERRRSETRLDFIWRRGGFKLAAGRPSARP
jgi:hypothetical protein